VGWLDFLLKPKGEDPRERYEDEVLGPMSWSEDDESWAGERNGIRFLIRYEGRSTPTDDLLAYARETLGDPRPFLDAIDQAKRTEISRNPRLADEIAGLQVEDGYFARTKAGRYFFATLAGGHRDRSWRVEFMEKHREGLDSTRRSGLEERKEVGT
jgi:hypothetical protein